MNITTVSQKQNKLMVTVGRGVVKRGKISVGD